METHACGARGFPAASEMCRFAWPSVACPHTPTSGGRRVALLRSYWAAAEGHRRRAARFVALVGLSALLEGLALATIIPLLSASDVSYHFGGWTLEGNGLRVLALSSFVTIALLSAGGRFPAEAPTPRLVGGVPQGVRRTLTGRPPRLEVGPLLAPPA